MLSLGGRVCLFNDSGVDALMGFLAEAGTKVSHHGGVKKVILPKLRQAEKELKVGVFANLLRSLFVSGAKPFLDDERAESNTAWKGGAAHPCACKTFGVALFNDCSRHEAGQLYPAIIGSEFVAKG